MVTRELRMQSLLRIFIITGVLNSLHLPLSSDAAAQIVGGSSTFCHMTDGTFTVCPDGTREWSDVPFKLFPDSQSYLYADQADLDPNLASPNSPVDTFMLMYDECGRTTPFGSDEYFRVSFTTVEVEDGVEKLEHYVIHIFTDGTIIFIEDGVPQANDQGEIRVTEIEGQRGRVGFGPSPNCSFDHVIAEFEIKLSATGITLNGGYSPDPQFWGAGPPQCEPTTDTMRPGDGVDNDCDGLIDEEKYDGEDDNTTDRDTDIDEDLKPLNTVVALFAGKGITSGELGSSSMGELQRQLLDRSGIGARAFIHDDEEAAVDFVTKYPANIVLIGHSWGGWATHIAAHQLNSQTPPVTVARLSQIDSCAGIPDPFNSFIFCGGRGDDILPDNVTKGLNHFQKFASGETRTGGQRVVDGSTNVDAECHFNREMDHTTIDDDSGVQGEVISFATSGAVPSSDTCVTPPGSPTRNVEVPNLITINARPGLVSGTSWDSGVIPFETPIFLNGLDGVIIRVSFLDSELRITDATGAALERITVELVGTVTVPEEDIGGALADIVDYGFHFKGAIGAAPVSGPVRILSAAGRGASEQSVDLNDTRSEFSITGFLIDIYQNGAGSVELTGLRIRLEADAITETPPPPPPLGLKVLVYGPASGSPSFVNKVNGFGHNVTVFTAAQWIAATTATFQQFDVIAIPTLLSSSQTATLAATNGVWGSALTGNIVITGLHADEHFNVGATQYLENVLAFAAAAGGTGFVSLTDCFTTPAYSWVPQTGPFVGLTAQSCTSTDTITITEPTHPVMSTPNGLTNALLSNWGQSLHTFFPTVGEFTVIATSSGGGTPPNSPSVLIAGAILPPDRDRDNDSVLDELDNCPSIPNSLQEDSNLNGIGDACETPGLQNSTAAFLQAGFDGSTVVEPTPLPVTEEPSVEEKLVRIVDFRVNAGLTDSASQLTTNLVSSLVDVGLVPPEAADDLIDDVLQQVTIQVTIDIKPGSDPNCFNNNERGVIPIAILGSAAFDVTEIDPASVQLQGLAVKIVGKSNKLLAHLEDVNNDGFQDLVVQIQDSDQVFSVGSITATLTGKLFNGMDIQGTDAICIVP